jgi:peptidoglycan/LPS O-acetylase OafA/YrhL
MNREVSTYLDCARVLAAILVVFDHVQVNWAGAWHFFVPLGSEAVAVLFVISGFVISYASSERETNMRDYLLSRAARLYSILIPSLLLCLFLDFAGQHFMPHYYANNWPPLHSKSEQILEGLYSLTFLGRAWGGLGWALGGTAWPGSMVPYWTLPFEVTYYLAFGAARYLRGWRRLLMLVAVCAIAGPASLVFLPLWLIGVVTHRLHLAMMLSVATGRTICVVAILLGLITNIIANYSGFTFGFSNDVLALWPYYVAGLWFALLTIGFSFSGVMISNKIGWMRWWAGASATLYLAHFPLARFINGLLPEFIHTKLRALAIVLSVIGVTLIVAAFGERRKTVFRGWIEAGCDWVQTRIERFSV